MKLYEDIAKFLGLETIPTVKIIHLKGEENFSGSYIPDENKVLINMGEIRSFRDLVYALAHEFAHSKQNWEIGTTALLSYYDDYEYSNNPLEIEADELAFAFENTMFYKNHIINPDTSSIWIMKKVLRNGS